MHKPVTANPQPGNLFSALLPIFEYSDTSPTSFPTATYPYLVTITYVNDTFVFKSLSAMVALPS